MKKALVALAAVLLFLAGVAGAVLFGLVYLFNPVADEWHCSQGEAPAQKRNGGSACFVEGSDLPKGWTWDPKGNRPLGE